MSGESEKLELTALNVFDVLKKCKKTEETTRYLAADLYSSGAGHKAPVLKFDYYKIEEYSETIKYMLCQLHAVHTGKRFLTPSYGLLNYRGENWTQDSLALFSLYYLGVASGYLPKFDKNIQGGVASPIGEVKSLRPTFWPPKENE